jgi:hypothetical protein
MEIFVCLLKTEDRNGKLLFFLLQTEMENRSAFPRSADDNSNRRLLFQQMYPSMVKGVKSLFVVERF